MLTLNLTAVGGSTHTLFKGQKTQTVLKCQNRQKIPIPRNTSAESKSWVMYPSKNINLCLFYASEQAKVQKRLLIVYATSHGRRWVAVGVGGKLLTGKNWHGKQNAWRFGPEDLVKTKLL
jgi:hypothetical protein